MPIAYVNGHVHTNGMENFWSLLKRGLKGTYVSVEPFHLFRYLDEQAFRFNNRERRPWMIAHVLSLSLLKFLANVSPMPKSTGKAGTNGLITLVCLHRGKRKISYISSTFSRLFLHPTWT